MCRAIGLCVATAWVLLGARATAAEVTLNGHVFTLPDAFEIELVAGPPLVDRPITAAFDEQGHLYVSDSSGSNDPVQKQLEDPPHRILRLADTDGDGRFDERTIYAEQMMFPEGTMWFDGSLYVAAPPSIWKLTDTDGDGVADERQEWFQGKTLTGCANDLHGPYLGPDGWIYWCKGAFAEQTYERPGKSPFVTRASHIFRCRPDGTGLEPVMTGGMDNPVDVVFTPTGERIFTTTFLVHPGGGFRDGLIHALYGGVYGKDHGVLDGHPRTGDLMPVLVHLGPAAPCGLARTESAALGAEYQDNVFACSFNLHKITRHVVQFDGPALVATSEDFLVSNNLDFHPTDILEDADGSLLICDTGGWYKLCCPTSQLWKPDLLGAIYRVRRREAPRLPDARGLKLAWQETPVAELAQRLADPRHAVRERATQALAKSGPRAVEALDGVRRAAGAPAALRRQAVWGLARIETDSSRAAVRTALADADESVRLAALHVVSLWRDGQSAPRLLKMLGAGSPAEQRLASEALGRIGDPSAAPALLAAVAKAAAGGQIDRRSEHALIYALEEIAAPDATRDALEAADAATRRAALIALDQMPGGGLEAADVISRLSASDPSVKDAAEWIARHHPEWGDAVVGHLRRQLANEELSAEASVELEEQLVRFSGSATVQALLGECLEQTSFSAGARGIALRAMARSGLKEAPAGWLAALVALLGREQGDLLAQAVTTVRALPPTKEPPPALGEALLRVAQIDALPVQVRLGALAAMPARALELTPELFDLIRGHVGADQPVAIRSAAAEAVAGARLSGVQLMTLAGAFQTVGPLEVDRLLSAYEQSTDPEVGKALAAALRPAPALASLRPDAIKRRLEPYGPDLQSSVDELMSALNVDVAKQRARLEELLSGVSEGDVRRGQAVFHSAKASCLACHAMGYVGGRLGPDLTRIGQIRTERDLLEAIIFPSASFVRSYEPVSVVTTDGKIHNGQVRLETAEAIVVVTGLNQEVRVERDDIEEILPSAISVMPSGLEQQLTRQNLADLVAFLKASK